MSTQFAEPKRPSAQVSSLAPKSRKKERSKGTEQPSPVDELLEGQVPTVVSTPSIDLSHKWATYKTTHPKGFYYYGKGRVEAIMKGQYKGSGTSLQAAWLFGGTPKEEWTTEILQTFPQGELFLVGKQWKDPGENAAYAAEKELITFEMLCDPFCLNDVPGGKGGYNWGRISRRALQKRAKAISDALKGKKRGPQKASTVAKRAATLRTPEVAAKLGHMKGKTHTPEAAAKISASWETRERKTCPNCGGSFTPSPYAKNHGENCKVAQKLVERAKWESESEDRKSAHYAAVSKKVAGSKNGTASPICVNGVWYGCQKEAVEASPYKYLYQLIRDCEVYDKRFRYRYEGRNVVKDPI